MNNNMKFKQELVAYILLIVGSILFAVGDVMFVNPYLMAPGGTYGLSNVFNTLWPWKISAAHRRHVDSRSEIRCEDDYLDDSHFRFHLRTGELVGLQPRHSRRRDCHNCRRRNIHGADTP